MELTITLPFLQTRNLHLELCTIAFLLCCTDFTSSYERNTLYQMNRTASKGETVIFHCNVNLTGEHRDLVWRKNGTTLYNYSPVINQTVRNYTSSRMRVDPRNLTELQISDVQLSDAGLYSCHPSNMQWILTIEENEEMQRSSHNTQLFYIIYSVTGAVAICVIIFFVVYIHRKQKKKEAFFHRRRVDEHQPHERRMNRNQSSQYFERFNSVYGEMQL